MTEPQQREPADWRFPNVATPTGSAAYYAIRFSRPQDRDRLATVFAWRWQFTEIAARASDPGVARLKLDWWREEIERLADPAGSRHPLARAIAPFVTRAWQRDALHGEIEICERRILRTQPRDTAEFQQHLVAAGRLGELLANDATAAVREEAAALSALVFVIDSLQSLGRDCRHGYCLFPKDMMHQHGISINDLADSRPLPQVAAWVDSVLEPHDGTVREPGRNRLRQAPALEPVIRLTSARLALLRAMRRQSFELNQRWIDISPLATLWHAWRP